MLSDQAHVRLARIDLDNANNLTDIREYIKHRASLLARSKRSVLKHDWLTDQTLSDAVRKAEGLFQWVSVVFDYLGTLRDPLKQLQTFLSTALSGARPERKLDSMYTQIFKACNWDDPDFVDGYQLAMGAIVTAKSPLSVAALQRLHGDTLSTPIDTLLAPLASLLPGIENAQGPVRILHQSLRDFITVRARDRPETCEFHLDDKEHSARLALLCLNRMNSILPLDIPDLHYLRNDAHPGAREPGIPKLAEGWIADDCKYACTYWISHLVETTEPSGELMNALTAFLSGKLVYWMEIAGVLGSGVSLTDVWAWINVSITMKFLVLRF